MLKKPDRPTKALLELADFMDRLDPKLYTQRQFEEGAAKCICGWCNHRTGHKANDTEQACKTLGLNKVEGMLLFSGNGGSKTGMIAAFYGGERTPGPKDAAKALRHLAVSGEIPSNW